MVAMGKFLERVMFWRKRNPAEKLPEEERYRRLAKGVYYSEEQKLNETFMLMMRGYLPRKNVSIISEEEFTEAYAKFLRERDERRRKK